MFKTLAITILLLHSVLFSNAFAEQIHILNWQGYGTDEAWALDIFKQNTSIDVIHDNFNSEQEMLTKLRTNPGVYDVVLINSSFTQQAAEEELTQAIDPSKLSHFADLSAQLRDHEYLAYGGKVYGVAWVWGVTSFAVNSDVINPVPDSLQVLWDAKYAGRVGWRDDPVEAIQLAALATGQDMNNPSDMGKIEEKLRALKPQIKTFWSSEDEWNKHLSAKSFDMAVYWSGSAARSKKAFGLPVTFVVPEEGAIAWFDGLSIAADAPNLDGAYKFIDFMIDPEFYVRWDNQTGAPASANAKANAQLPTDAFNRTVLGDPAVVERLRFMAPLSDEKRQQYLELWQQTKTYFAE